MNSRFYVKSNFGHWSVMDRKTGKMVVGYAKKSDAQITADGLNRIRSAANISKMKTRLQTVKGYGYYIIRSKK